MTTESESWCGRGAAAAGESGAFEAASAIFSVKKRSQNKLFFFSHFASERLFSLQ
jgi:hypothetical protein